MKTMIAKYRGSCGSCGQMIQAGQQINFYGKGHAVHTACDQADEAEPRDEDARAGFEPGTLANDRRLATRGLSVVRFAGGAVVTRNTRGRCEDAPCCGCCT